MEIRVVAESKTWKWGDAEIEDDGKKKAIDLLRAERDDVEGFAFLELQGSPTIDSTQGMNHDVSEIMVPFDQLDNLIAALVEARDFLNGKSSKSAGTN